MTTSNIYWERFELNALKKMPIEDNGIDRFTVRKGDLLVCEGGDAGRSAVWEYDRTICFQNHVHRVRPYLNVGSWYIYFFLQKMYLSKEIEQYKKGVGIQSLSGDALASILLPLPPAQEQKHIISRIKQYNDLIDEIDQNQDDLQQAIKNTKSKILDLAIRGKLVPQDPNDEPASVLLERIKAEQPAAKKMAPKTRDNSHYPFKIPNSWTWCDISEICEVSPKNKMDDRMTVSFVPMTLISDGFSNKHMSTTRNWGEIKRGFTHFQDGDIGIAKITPCFENRKSVVFQSLENQSGAGTTEIHVLRPMSKSIFPNYLLWFVKSDDFIANGISSFTGAVGQQRVGSTFIKETQLPLPPFSEQKRIVKKIEEIFSVLDNMQNSIKA